MLKHEINKLLKSTFFRSVFKVGSGQLIAQCLTFISVPILSRIYSDTAYGDTAIITSTAAILIHASTLGLNSAVMKPEEDEEAKVVFTTAFLANFIICTLFVLGCYLVSRYFFLFKVTESYGLALLFMWLYTILNENSSLLLVYSNRKGRYNRLFFNPIIGAGVNLVVAVPLGLLGLGYKGFMITYIVQYGILCVHMAWRDNPFANHYRVSDFKRVLREYKDYILFQYPSNFISNFGVEYPMQYLGRAFTTQELGGYSMCVRTMQYPIRLVAAPISTVYFRTATEYHREGKNLAGFTFKMVSRILLISVIPVGLFIFFSEPIFGFVLGEGWRNSGKMASFLVIQYVFLFCTQSISYCRVAIGKQKTNLQVTVICLAVAACTCWIGHKIFGTLSATVFCYSLGQCFYNIYDMAENFNCMDRKFVKRYLLISLTYLVVMFGLVAVKQLAF